MADNRDIILGKMAGSLARVGQELEEGKVIKADRRLRDIQKYISEQQKKERDDG